MVAVFPFYFALADTSSVTVSIVTPECADGSDNDGNSLIDFPNDPGCSSAIDDDERTLTQCSDGIDNDSDGRADFPSDIGCDSASDDNEYNAPTQTSAGAVWGGSSVSAPVPASGLGNIIFRGTALPNSTVKLMKGSVVIALALTNLDGTFEIDLAGVNKGVQVFTLHNETNGQISSLFTIPVMVTESAVTDVGGIVITSDKNEESRTTSIGDINSDGKVNLIDFSIVAFWYKKPNPPLHIDLNKDGRIDLADFSILAYRWKA